MNWNKINENHYDAICELSKEFDELLTNLKTYCNFTDEVNFEDMLGVGINMGKIFSLVSTIKDTEDYIYDLIDSLVIEGVLDNYNE